MADLKFKYGGATAKLVPWENGKCALANVYSKTQNQGHGTGLMQKITDFADTHGITIVTIAQPYGKDGLDVEQLEDFYTKFGFVVDKGTRRPHFMTRRPSQEKHGP